MMKKSLWICGFSIMLAGSLIAGTANDTAADSVYDNGWQGGDNGGSGFGDWVMGYWATNGVDRVGIGSSTANGGAFDIDTGGRALYLDNVDQTNNYIDVFRYLDQPLQPGQTFSMDMDINWRNGFKGFWLRDVGEVNIFRMEIGDRGDGDAAWVDQVVGGATNLSFDYDGDTQYHIALEQTSVDGGTWSVTRSGGLSDFDSGTYTGKVESLQLFSLNASSNIQSRTYYNNFDVSYTPGFDHYAAWTNQYGLSGSDADYDADPDNDMMKNLLEFSVGRNPTNNEGGFRAPNFLGNSTNGLVYVYTRYNEEKAAAMSLDYSMVLTEGLLSPSWDTNGFVELPPVYLFEDLVTVTNYIPTTNATTFATWQVEAL